MDCNCILCNKKLKNIIYSLKNMPAFVQNMSDSPTDNSDSIDLDLYECEACSLIQFNCEPVYYYKDVIRAVGLSDTLRKLRIEQYEYLYNKFDLKGKKIWEVGCGGGEFLGLWNQFDVFPFGVENNERLVDKAQKENLNVIDGYVDENYIDSNGPFEAFTSFNYLEHQPKPSELVKGIYNNLKEGGVGLLTVPSFEYFIEKASYYEFMRDHIAYYTETALKNLFLLNGFDVIEIGRFNGDTTYIIVQKRRKVSIPDFDKQKNYLERKINEYACKRNISHMCVWGASHQAFTLLATLNLNFDLSYIIDSSSMKWDKYSPVSHLKILSPNFFYNDENEESVLIMAPAFSHEIFNNIRMKKKSINNVIAVKDDDIIVFDV